jgi:hypothetical protein
MHSCALALFGAAMCMATPAIQESHSSSAASAEELVRLMQQQKLDAIAARDTIQENRYAAALVFPGAQIMSITGIYPVPVLMDERLLRRDDREAYVELNRAAERQGRLFVQDLGADGLHAAPPAPGRVDVVFVDIDTRTIFSGDWKPQQLSRDEYLKRFAEADGRYARALQALVQELKSRAVAVRLGRPRPNGV